MVTIRLFLLPFFLFATLLYADSEPNNWCSQSETISAFDGLTTSATLTLNGSITKNSDNIDNYHFTVGSDGTLDLSAATTNNKQFKLKVGSSCNGNNYYDDGLKIHNGVSSIALQAGDSIHIRVENQKKDTTTYRLDLIFTSNTAVGTAPEPIIDQCGMFPSVLNAYDTIEFEGSGGLGSAATVLNIDNIVASDVTPSNPPATGYATCDGVACQVNDPFIVDLGIPYVASSNTATVNVTASTEITALDGANYIVGLNGATQPTVTFTASTLYADSPTRKYMSIASLDSLNKTGIKYIFSEGDYYVGSWTHQGNDLTIEVNGNVRIFLQGPMEFQGNTLSINTPGVASNLFFYGQDDFLFPNMGSAHYDVNAFFYTKGNFVINGNSNSGTGFTGGITSEHNITMNNNQKFTYDDTGLDDIGLGMCGWCTTNHIGSSGFQLVPYSVGGVDKTFEIFCDASDPNDVKDLIALPIKNGANNFVFNSDTLTNQNYYDRTNNARTDFHAIEINANTWKVKTGGGTTGGNAIMGRDFSNINLLGTPFAIDWTDTNISNCTESKLRKAYFGQAVKIDTLDYDKATCRIEDMSIKLLDDYRYLVYNGSEVLEKSCKEMAELIPDNVGILNDVDVKGHFWIDPFNDNRSNTTDITADGRPVVAYCWYQQDLQYVWTFLLGLDAKVTVSKNDLTAKQDTCSEFGLYFFVPNTKETFNRVREYLFDKKSEWIDYTGTVDEKINALYTNNHYYIPAEQTVDIWPYGPFGVYYPNNGSSAWEGSNKGVRGNMSGSPMHNISTMANYTDSMGYKGWVSILQDLNKTNEWWIDDNGAGERLDCSGGGCTNNRYYEPNGNYTANAWLNFLYDSNGWVYHNDDWNNNYPYYDYMCMAEDNYDNASRYSLVPGRFTVVESGNGINDTNLTTQVVDSPISFDLLMYDYNATIGQVNYSKLSTQNKSVGVFLSKMVDNGNGQTPQLVSFLGSYFDFASNNGRITIPDFTVSSAIKESFVTFLSCNDANATWTDCWAYNNNPSSPVVTELLDANQSDSLNDFAIRPKAFSFSSSSGLLIKAGNSIDLSIRALTQNGVPTPGYNESQNISFTFDVNMSDPTKVCEFPEINITPNILFSNGEDNRTGHRFSEVGIFDVNISEIPGSEFAAVDNGDTPDAQRYIEPFGDTLAIIPDHFDIKLSLRNFNDGSFTYLSTDFNMSSTLDVNITAKRLGDPANPADDNVTRNYTDGCYAKTFNLNVSHTGAPAPLGQVRVFESSALSEYATNAPISLNALPASRFTTDHNGTAELSMQINFDRNKTEPVNPFAFSLSDLNVSDIDGAEGTLTDDSNATYFFGRSHAPRYRIENDIGVGTVYYEVYCRGDCNATLANIVAPNRILSVDDVGWFRNELHNNVVYGDVSAINERSAANKINESRNSMTQWTFIYDQKRGYPYKALMQMTSPAWLLYNRFNAGATTNDFMLEFHSNGNWQGDTQHTTKVNSAPAVNTSRRIDW